MKSGVFIFLLLATSSLYGIRIEQIVYRATHEAQMLEVCVVELYFSQLPIINTNRSISKATQHVLKLDLSDVHMTPADMMKLQEVKGLGYMVSPTIQNNSLVITITYDPEKISVIASPAVSINMQHGLVIRLFDQSLLRTLSDQSRPVLSVAYLS